MQQTSPTAPGRDRRGRRYRPGLDGVRALAVAAVVAYHLAPGSLPGGFLGVDVFFVISGYLITGLLVEEWRASGGRGIDLRAFWVRRVRRLYPAVVALLAFLVVLSAIFDRAALAGSRVAIPMALVYQTNWWFIYHHVSYFARFGPPPLLLHLWSLAIEEQYYLLWPPILLALLRWRRRRERVVVFALIGAVASAALMAVAYHSGASLDRVYYGTDTHSEGLLLGSALGLFAPPANLSTRVGDRGRRVMDRAAVVCLAGLGVMMATSGYTDAFTWEGGLALAVVLAAVLTVVAAHPASRTGRWLSVRPLRWLGTRSYSVYLWHWPVIVLTGAQGAFPLPEPAALVVRLGATAVLAEASYRWVERPWRTGAAQRAIRARLARSVRARRQLIAASGGSLAALVLVAALVPGPAPFSRRTRSLAASEPVTAGSAAVASRSDPYPPGAAARIARLRARLLPSSLLAPPPARHGILAIGDSVLLAAEPALQATFGARITVDAAVGRQVYTGLDRLAEYRAAGRLDTVEALVVDLGSNGVFTRSDLAELETLAAGVPRVVLVNVRVPDPWGRLSNQTIDSVAHRPGYRVVDWWRASEDKALLYPDGVHPDPAGAAVYARMLQAALGPAGRSPGAAGRLPPAGSLGGAG